MSNDKQSLIEKIREEVEKLLKTDTLSEAEKIERIRNASKELEEQKYA